MTQYLSNKTFDDIQIGDSASLTHKVSLKDIQLFAKISGDMNPAHVDAEYAKSDIFHKIIAHGIWTGTLISTLLGTQLPGPGTIYLSQSFQFIRPVGIGDQITANVTVIRKLIRKPVVLLDCYCINQNHKIVLRGLAKVLAPAEKVRRKKVHLPGIAFQRK